MAKPESDKERQRLAFLYAGMSEGELEKLAKDEGTLTALARAALKSELSRRGLTIGREDSGVVPSEKTHTRGFCERTAVLYHHARGTPPKRLFWVRLPRGRWRIDWRRMNRGAK